MAALVVAAGCGSDDEGRTTTTTRTVTTQTAPGGGVQPEGTATGADGGQEQATTGADVGQSDTTQQDVGEAGTTTTTPNDDAPIDDGTSVAGQALSGEGGSVFRPFAANSPWNTLVDQQSTDPRSQQLIRQALLRLGAVEDQGSNVAARQNEGSLLEGIIPDEDSSTTGDEPNEDQRAAADDRAVSGDETSTGGVRTARRSFNSPLFVNTRRWTTPIVDATAGETTQLVCRQVNLPPPNNFCGDGWLVNQLSIPPEQNPPFPQYDGWLTVIDRPNNVAYDLWRARREDDGASMSYQFLRRWDLNGPGFLAPTFPSARGSGLPLFAGLLQPEEIRAGRITHALAISVPGPAQRRYVQPASVTDGNGEADALPEGARIRLKRGVTLRTVAGRRDPRCRRRFDLRTEGLTDDQINKSCKPYAFPGRTNRRAAEAILTALKRYGAIVVDRSRTPTLYAEFDDSWRRPLRNGTGVLLDERGRTLRRDRRRLRGQGTPLLRGNEVSGLFLTDFEVVRLPVLRRDPPLEAVPVTPLAGGATPQRVPTQAPRTRQPTRRGVTPQGGATTPTTTTPTTTTP